MEASRIERVTAAVQAKMTSEELIGKGRRQGASDPEIVRKDSFDPEDTLIIEVDGIGTAPSADGWGCNLKWRDVHFAREHLIGLWSEASQDNGIAVEQELLDSDPARRKPIDIKETEQRYRQRVANWPSGRPPPSRADDEEWCRDELGLPRDRARDLRRKLAPPDWSEPGARRKSGRD